MCQHLQWSKVVQWSGTYLVCDLQISLSETLVWRAAEMVQRLDLTSLTAPEDEEHTEAATDVPMQMSLVSISSLAANVRYASSGFAVSQVAQPLHDMRCELRILPVHPVTKCVQCADCFTDVTAQCSGNISAVFAVAYMSS